MDSNGEPTSSHAASGLSDVYIPIVLGVTAHRDIRPADLDALEEAVEKVLQEFRMRHPLPTPLRILSMLAPGGDQLVARVAAKSKCKVEVVAPLPFPAEVYAWSSTFEGYNAERSAFLDWIKKINSFVVPYRDLSATSDIERWKEVVADNTARHECYANAGGYIARHCYALIALWDGQESGKESGTWEIVHCKLEGKLPKRYPEQKPLQMGGDEGPVYVIHTPRISNEIASPGTPGDLRVIVPCPTDAPKTQCKVPDSERNHRPTPWILFWRRFFEAFSEKLFRPAPQIAEWRQFLGGFQDIQDLNDEIHGLGGSEKAKIRKRIDAKRHSKLWQPILDSGEGNKEILQLLRLRETIAALARDRDSQFRGRRVIFFLFLFIAALSLHLRPELAGHKWVEHWALPVFVFFLAACMVIVALAFYRRLYERPLDYRAFGEALRVRLCWAAAGIGESVADNYLVQVRGELGWARRALLAIAPPPAVWQRKFADLPNNAVRAERLEQVTKEWVAGQRKFYRQTSDRNRHLEAFLGSWGFGIAILGMLGVVTVVGPFLYEFLGFSKELAVNQTDYLLVGSAIAILFFGLVTLRISDSYPRHAYGLSVAGVTAGVAGILVFFGMIGVVIHKLAGLSVEEKLDHRTLIGSAIAILFGGFLLAFREQASYKELANLYERMLSIFDKGKEEIEALLRQMKAGAPVAPRVEEVFVLRQGEERIATILTEDESEEQESEGSSIIQRIQQVLVALGREAITENAQWIILRRARPLELRPP